VFTEVFLVQIRQKFQKIHYEVRIQAKNNSENALQRLKLGAKKKIRGGKERSKCHLHTLVQIIQISKIS
jgi:hypothetical protein